MQYSTNVLGVFLFNNFRKKIEEKADNMMNLGGKG
jgi:hypothetical protein